MQSCSGLRQKILQLLQQTCCLLSVPLVLSCWDRCTPAGFFNPRQIWALCMIGTYWGPCDCAAAHVELATLHNYMEIDLLGSVLAWNSWSRVLCRT